MTNENFDTKGIFYLENKYINRARWDECIDQASNGLIYARSFYLDAMAKHWDALVMNEYEMVMPVTWNKKFGIYYLYQPFLCASSGVFGNNITPAILKCFLDKIPRRFKYWDIYLNRANNFEIESYNFYIRTNYVLDLNRPYDGLLHRYRSSYKNLIKKSTARLQVKKDIDVQDIIKLANKKMNPAGKIKKSDWGNFVLLYNKLLSTSQAVNFGVYLENELLASGVFFFYAERAYYVLAGNSPVRSSLGASHLVINSFIENYSGRKMVLDFEGSSIPGIAFFFKGFGAGKEEYPGIKYNALPWLIRNFKK